MVFETKLASGDIVRAFAEGRLCLVKQPVVDVTDPRTSLYSECLSVLMRADGTMVRAGSFVPELERSNLIHLLDARVMDLVLDDLEADGSAINGCNISAASFLYPAPWHELLTRLEARAHLLDRLVIEVTESLPLMDLSVVCSRMRQLQALGCRIAVDDFGAGYSSPQLILSVDFDIIKIDAAFVRTIRIGSNGMSSLGHMVAMAHCVAPIVVVEGIETADHLDWACKSGATHLQGYLLSPPPSALQSQTLTSQPSTVRAQAAPIL